MSRGIFVLANDRVYDSFVAFLNSVEVNIGEGVDVCVIPYDKQIDKVKKEIENRPAVRIFQNIDSMKRWDGFANEVWSAHPISRKWWVARPWMFRKNLIRKFCSFDGDFEEFVFYDVDTLAMSSLDEVFDKLRSNDFVFDDLEHNKKSIIGDLPLLSGKIDVTAANIARSVHACDFFASKKGVFADQEVKQLKFYLINEEEIKFIGKKRKNLRDSGGWWDEVYLFNYMTLRSGRPKFNFTQSANPSERTGNCAKVDHFIEKDHVLYNLEGAKPIHRIHYMGYTSNDIARLCRGYNVNVNYSDIFLYYRFLKEPKALWENN